jgi:hypothetical protein
MSGFFLKKSEKIFCLCSELVLSLFQQTKKAHIMKKYIVITQSDWSFCIAAKNSSEAEKTGRRLCRHTNEKFVTVRLVK